MPDNCMESCPVLPRVEALERSSEQNGATHREIFERLRHVEKSGAVQEAALEAINEKLDKLIHWQEEQKKKPGAMMDRLKENIIWAICAAAIGFLLARFGI